MSETTTVANRYGTLGPAALENLQISGGAEFWNPQGREIGQPRIAVVSRTNWRWPISL